jgi:4-hydroxyphenylpyruvate dioxygenase
VLDGVEFLEFAVDETTGGALAGFVRALGFRHAGRHRSKAVELYRQGRTNLVLNQEQDSAASEHFQLHGPSACAMALRVDDAERAVSRAKALLYPDWQEPIGEGERSIPAVRTPDGTLVYLVSPDSSGRSIWEDDFELRDGGPDQGDAGLDTVDHIAQALPFGRMDTYVLFWRALFGLQLEQQWVSPDPYGLIQSKALISPERSVRMSLNVSESRETALGRSVSSYSGAGVHHIAFTTEDIVRTAETLKRLGAPMLPVPANYYDDLSARLGLDDATLADLQRLELLYDHDERGEFIHAYTDAFEGRFFFETVQRRGYQGFGVVNAAVRMASQAQRRMNSGIRPQTVKSF